MKKPYRQADGFYHVDGKKYKTLFGSREQVMNGTVYKTTGGLTKADLVMNKWGRIVSAKKFKTAKKEMRLQKHGFFAKKGKFGAITRKFRGGRDVAELSDAGKKAAAAAELSDAGKKAAAAAELSDAEKKAAAEKITNINPANTFVAPVVDAASTAATAPSTATSTDAAASTAPSIAPSTGAIAPSTGAAAPTAGGANSGAKKKTRSPLKYDKKGNVIDKYDKKGNVIKNQKSYEKTSLTEEEKNRI